MTKGFVKLNRQLFDHPLWNSERFTKGQAWVDLFGKANYASKWIIVRGIKVEVKRGETCRSEETLARDWRWSRGKVRRFLFALECDKMITRRQYNKIGIISICNYCCFQDSDACINTAMVQQTEQQTEQQTVPKQEGKEIKKERKNPPIVPPEDIKPTRTKKPLTDPPDIETWSPSDNLLKWGKSKDVSPKEILIRAEQCFDYFRSKGRQLADWDAGLRNWIIRDLIKTETPQKPVKEPPGWGLF